MHAGKWEIQHRSERPGNQTVSALIPDWEKQDLEIELLPEIMSHKCFTAELE